MFSGCERKILHPISESNQEDLSEEDGEDISVQHTGDPFIHGDLYIEPAEEEE